MIILPAPDLPSRGWLLILAGLLLVAASLAGPPARWRAVGTLAAAVAVLESALGRPALAVLAVEGVLILGYLLLLDAPVAMPGAVAARWLRLQVPGAFWGTVTALASREEQSRVMLDDLFGRIAEVTGRETGQVRADARRNRLLSVPEAIEYGLVEGPATRRGLPGLPGLPGLARPARQGDGGGGDGGPGPGDEQPGGDGHRDGEDD